MPANRFTQTGNYKERYSQDVGFFATYSEQISLIVLIALGLLLPLFVPKTMMFTVNLVLVYVIAVMGLNITTGYTGLINIGQGAFLGVGAYTTALVAGAGAPFVLAIICGGVAGAMVGTLVGLPSLRLKHLYLAIATLAFQVIFVWLVGHSTLLKQGGALDLPKANFFGIEPTFTTKYTFWFYFIYIFVIIMALIWRNFLRTKYGRAFIAVRDNDRAADAMGIDPGQAKLLSFSVGSFYAGIAGGLYAYLVGAVVIEDYTLHTSIKFLAMSIVGGLGTVVGSFLGPAFLEWLDQSMEHVAAMVGGLGIFPTGVDAGSALRPLAFGLVIVLFLMFEPRGLANWWRLLRTYFKRWPFKY